MNPFEQDSSFFLYDLDLLSRTAASIKAKLSSEDRLLYAMKANALSPLLQVIAGEGLDFDFASSGELSQLQKVEASAQNAIATGPAKSPVYIEEILDSGCQTIVLESLQQLKDLNAASQKKKLKSRALLRIQLEWESNSSSVLGGSKLTPFGLHPEDWKKAKLSDYPHVEVFGVHCFQWGNILEVSQFEAIWSRCAQEAIMLSESMGFPLSTLDVGGGLGIDYVGSNTLSMDAVVEVIKKVKQKYEIPHIWMELGRYLTADCGKFYSRVIDRKTIRGQEMLILSSGINALMRPALTFEPFPAVNYTQEEKGQSPLEDFAISGPLCTALDTLGTQKLSSSTQVGDWVEFSKVGAYGFSESMPFFLGHDIAAEYVTKHGECTQLRAPMQAKDYFR